MPGRNAGQGGPCALALGVQPGQREIRPADTGRKNGQKQGINMGQNAREISR